VPLWAEDNEEPAEETTADDTPAEESTEESDAKPAPAADWGDDVDPWAERES